MSMLSSMCENLRLMARLVREYDYREISRCLREAADTIEHLRDDLQRANSENAKLKRFAKLDESTISILNNCTDDLNVENAKLREQIERLRPKDCEGNELDIADKVHMLRSEYDGDHEWEDVVVELALTKWGGDRWIVRGSRGDAWACDCTKTGYDEDAYEASDEAVPLDKPTLVEVENVKLRELVRVVYGYYASGTINPCDICDSIGCQYVGDAESGCRYHNHFDSAEAADDEIQRRMRELGIEVE